ncbi:hypothetical protein C8J57DRAFT_1025179, partial [Mycena rebaudengoi]
LPPPPQSPPADSLQVVQISSLAAALEKLNIGIPVEDVIKAVHREDEAKRSTSSAQATQRRAALSNRNSTRILTPSLTMNLPSARRTTPDADPLAKERRRRLVELTQEAFPDGKVPDPF